MAHNTTAPHWIHTGSTGHSGIYKLHERDRDRTIEDILAHGLPDQQGSATSEVQEIAVEGLQLSLFE